MGSEMCIRDRFDRILETRTTDGLDEANAIVTEAAWVPTDPIKPRKMFIVGLALLGSLLIAAAVACLLELLNDTVNSKTDIDTRLKTRLLGILPLIDNKNMKGAKDIPLSPKLAASMSETFSEAVNTCRTALSLGIKQGKNGGKDFQILLVTSLSLIHI